MHNSKPNCNLSIIPFIALDIVWTVDEDSDRQIQIHRFDIIHPVTSTLWNNLLPNSDLANILI